jgi:hypothetical protein
MNNISFMITSDRADGVMQALPSEYTPYPLLTLCSNILTDVRAAISFKSIPILLVGKGTFPLVWLAGPTESKRDQWRFIVAKSVSRYIPAKVDIDGEAATVAVSLGSIPLLRVRSTGVDAAEVMHVDLRPLGLDIEGSTSSLRVGKTSLSRNRIEGVQAAIALS